MGFPEEPRLERGVSCPQILSTERSLYMPLSIILHQQEEATYDVVEDPPRPEQPFPEVEVERTSVPDSPPPVPPPTAPVAPETAGPSSTSQQPSEHVLVSYRELSAVMDVICTLATTQAWLNERMAGAEVTLLQNHAMLLRIMSHLSLLPVSVTKPTQPTTRD